MTIDKEYGNLEEHPCVVAFAAILCLLLFGFTMHDMKRPEYLPEFWVKLPAVEGLERGTGASRPPTFNITLRVNNRDSEPWHFKGPGRVVVAYAGVPLAHADLAEFTVPGEVISSVPIVATSSGLGLPDELYDRMQSQRRRRERVKLAVHVTLDGLRLWCTAILHGQPRGPFVCPILYGPTFDRTDPRQMMFPII
ncbi:unnamed protein product [Triticum turgidum subsp. durum]|uniref:Late embryogenesis abundant protein LEA-2 subgroup domain-containing protein n=1 Tax=Triticum turgidum subsp. durum TaxID=4567 RepID=A0A9R1QNC9_TRITD|nr:unnamed protein product [Triticum turgidum subsp. durum]